MTCFESVYPPHCSPSCTVPYLTSVCEEQASGATSVQGAAGRRGSTAQTTATGTNLSHLNYSSSRWIPFLLNFKLKQTDSPWFSALSSYIWCHPNWKSTGRWINQAYCTVCIEIMSTVIVYLNYAFILSSLSLSFPSFFFFKHTGMDDL